VDDNTAIRSALIDLLSAAGLVVVGQGASGADAVLLSRDLQPDLLVLDDRMPRVTGLEAIAEIRRLAPTTKILLYSGTPEAVSGATHAPDVVVPKGAHPTDLLTVIADLLSLSR